MPRFATLSGAYTGAQVKTASLDPGLADRLTGLVWADAAGSLQISQSDDGVNWDYNETVITVAPSVGQKFSLEVIAPYLQAVYTNGGSAANVRCSLRFASAGAR